VPTKVTLEARLVRAEQRAVRYELGFAASGTRAEIVDEVIEEADDDELGVGDVLYYRFHQGLPLLNVRDESGTRSQRHLQLNSLAPGESILSQRRDPDQYPEIGWCADQFSRIQMFREWSFGRDTLDAAIYHA
jgi:hypothetical protein